MEAYKKMLGWTQLNNNEILKQFNDENLREDDFYRLQKQQLYTLCREIVDLQRQKLTLNTLFDEAFQNEQSEYNSTFNSDFSFSFFSSEQSQFSLTINGQQKTFSKVPTAGDGWCTFRAIGEMNPENCIDTLINLCQTNPALRSDLSETILANYLASSLGDNLDLLESFEIGDNEIKREIVRRQLEISNEEDYRERERLNVAFKAYLSSPRVCKAYLEEIKKTKYAELGVVQAYAKYVKGKQVAAIILYGQRYTCTVFDDPQDQSNGRKLNTNRQGREEDILWILFEPGSGMGLAHYSQLTVLPMPSQTLSQSTSSEITISFPSQKGPKQGTIIWKKAPGVLSRQTEPQSNVQQQQPTRKRKREPEDGSKASEMPIIKRRKKTDDDAIERFPGQTNENNENVAPNGMGRGPQ